jgi:hypothetical protein
MDGARLARSFLAACLLLSLACGGNQHLEDLPQPTIWWTQRSGNCDLVRALDGHGDVWVDSGCEGDPITLEKVGSASREKVDAVSVAAARLPRPPREPADGICNTVTRHVFGVRESGAETAWLACGTGRMYGDTSGLEGPFLELATSFKELP